MSDNFENNTHEYTSEHKNVIHKEKKKLKSGVIVLIVMLCAVVLLSVAQIVSATLTTNHGTKNFTKQKNTKTVPHTTGKYVAKLYIEGTIQEENDKYNQEWLIETIEELKKDSNNVGILLVIDSPGGTVYEADEAYLKLMEYRAEKPIWAYFEHMATSGGYYIACSAENIGANRNTITGSIGVIAGRSVDLTEFMSNHGIKMTTITAGKNKNMMGIDAPFTEEQKAIMQSMANECYDQFVGIVSDSRDMSLATVKSLADGRIYTANQAKANGLIDQVCSIEDYQNAYKSFLQNEKIAFKELRYEREKKFYEDFFRSASKIKNQSAETEIFNKLISTNLTYPAYIYTE